MLFLYPGVSLYYKLQSDKHFPKKKKMNTIIAHSSKHLYNLNHKLTIGCAFVFTDELSYRMIIELNARGMDLRRLMRSFLVCDVQLTF